MNKNIVTCTGYGSTGSSAISDLLQEFSEVKSFGDFEFTFLSSVGGVRDLEFGLFELNNRSNVDMYIKSFLKEINYLSKKGHNNYEKWFNGKFKKLSYEFIDSLIDITWDGYNLKEIREENFIIKLMYYIERFYQKKILLKKDSSAIFYTKVMNKKRYYACPTSKEFFYEKVQLYLKELFNNVQSNSGDKLLVFDQLVPPTDIESYFNYIPNLKVVVVDRDPIDLYLLEKYEYKEMFMPHKDVKTFVKWYKAVRKCKKTEKHKNILRINFEDLIYNYDLTTSKIINFLNLDQSQWIQKKKFFNPEISSKNTNKIKYYSSAKYKKDIKFIKNNLAEYCYDFNLG